jgi:hypothetical protein
MSLARIPIYNRNLDNLFALLMFFSIHGTLPKRNSLTGELFYQRISPIMDLDLVKMTTDKWAVKRWVSRQIGEEYCLKTLSVLETARDIQSFSPNRPCVFKPTVGSGMVMFADKDSKVDREQLTKWLGGDFYKKSRQRNYQGLKQRIIVEELAFGQKGADDIKFFCVDGSVRLIQWDFDRAINHTRRLYTRDWLEMDISIGYPLSSKSKDKPHNLPQMIEVAEKLAASFDFIRVDMYCSEKNDGFYIGELTHCHGGAMEMVIPKGKANEIDLLMFAERGSRVN